MERFLRTEMILGQKSMEYLKAAHVAVFGVGGVGSYAAEALLRGGVYNLTLIDADTINITNINRQIHAISSTVGLPKTQAMKTRALEINPNALIHTEDIFALPENIPEIWNNKWNYVIDALDTVTTKIHLAKTAFKSGIPIISAMSTGNKTHPELLELGDIYETSVCPIAKVMRAELKKLGVPSLRVCYSKEPPKKPLLSLPQSAQTRKRATPGSVSFVPPAAGMIMAGDVIRNLAGFRL